MLGKKIGVHRWTQIDTDFLLFLSLSVLICVNLWTVFTLFAEGGLSRLRILRLFSRQNIFNHSPLIVQRGNQTIQTRPA